MKKSVLLAGIVTLGLSMGGPAFAQNTSAAGQSSAAQNSGAPQTGPGDSMGGMTGAGSQYQAPPEEAAQQALPNDGTAPSNRKNSDYGTLEPGDSNTNPGVNLPPTTRNTETTESRLPIKGANSFSEAEAKHTIEHAGYTQVSGLAKDDQSIWRGTAMKGDTKVSVALDYKGNVTDDQH